MRERRPREPLHAIGQHRFIRGQEGLFDCNRDAGARLGDRFCQQAQGGILLNNAEAGDIAEQFLHFGRHTLRADCQHDQHN